MRYQFDEFEVDIENFALLKDGKYCPVEPLVFDLIAFLSRNTGRVITRDEIIDHVWKGRIVSDATVASCIKSARKALDDSGSEQKYIQTIRGRGIQFLGSVQLSNADDRASNDASAVVPPPRPSLAIVPFQVFGDEAALMPIADSLVENLTTILTRIPLLSVASRSSMFALKGEPVDAQEVGRRFKVRYMLEGSLQKVQDQLRANVQLIETQNGFHL
jgi:DNA-binding winged helix-turn-helix (wHTH) protein